jgi:magnesium-transporting ATPase (P-type)
MCTGDNLDTATAISKNAGIIPRNAPDTHPEYSRMEGKDFRGVVGVIKKLRDPSCTETDPKKYKMLEFLENQGNFN